MGPGLFDKPSRTVGRRTDDDVRVLHGCADRAERCIEQQRVLQRVRLFQQYEAVVDELHLVADYSDALAPSLEFYETEAGERSGLAGGTWRSLVSVRGDTTAGARFPLDVREPLERELSAFVAAVAAGEPAPVGSQDALAAVAIADAFAESIRTGLPVRPEGL